MIVTVHVKTVARENSVNYDENTDVYLVSVKARPTQGEANKAIIGLLSEYLNIPKSQISLKTGSKSKVKLFEY